MLYNGISNFNDAERIPQKKIEGVYLVFFCTIETYYYIETTLEDILL